MWISITMLGRRCQMASAKSSRQIPPKIAFIPVLAVVLAVLALACILWLPSLSAFPRLEVDGHRITEAQYLQAMYRARNDVLSDHAAAGISLKDWNEDTALGNPCELITRRTLEILSEYYAVSGLAVERGYLADAGYDAMLRDLEDFNRRRQEALEAGSVITGIPQFTAEDYLSYRTSNLKLQFTSDSANPENRVTPEEIRQRYEADKDNLYSLPDELELGYLVISAGPEEAEALAQELEALRQLALEKGTLALALEEMPQLKDYYEEITVDRGSYSIYSRSHGDILGCADQLQTGDISEVFRKDGWLCLVQCHRRTRINHAPLEEVESVVIQSIRESRYDALITARMEEMKIDADLPALLRFTAEQFN